MTCNLNVSITSEKSHLPDITSEKSHLQWARHSGRTAQKWMLVLFSGETEAPGGKENLLKATFHSSALPLPSPHSMYTKMEEYNFPPRGLTERRTPTDPA